MLEQWKGWEHKANWWKERDMEMDDEIVDVFSTDTYLLYWATTSQPTSTGTK